MIQTKDAARSNALRSAVIVALLVCSLATTSAAEDCVRGPVAAPDTALYEGWNPVVVDVLANDLDEDGEAVEVELIGGTCNAVATLEHGLLSLDFAPTVSADCVVRYRLRNANGDTSATVDVVVDVAILLIFEDRFESGNTSAWSAP